MFKILLLLFCIMGIMQAGLLDFWNAKKAKEAYTEGNYTKASSLYQSLDQTNDSASYNLGNAYYKQKAYDKALEAYQHVKEPSLLPQTLHNIGNTYAALHQNDKAILAYESALKLKEDKDTRFNLELLKKEQEKQKQKNQPDSKQDNDKQQKSSSNEQQKDTNSSNGSSKPEPQKSESSQNEPSQAKDANASQNEQQPTPSKPKENKPSSPKQEAQKEADQKGEQQQAQATQPDDQNAPISSHEERQWDKMLNQRGVNTLMLPLSNKGEHDANTKPW